MNLRRILLSLGIIVLFTNLAPFAAGATSNKIAPRVLADTANGAVTEALVVLSEQADLREACGPGSAAEV